MIQIIFNMISQYKKIKKVLDHASHLSHIDKTLLQKFYNRIEEGALIRDDNPDDHFSTFFVPYSEKTKQIFMGDHIKSGVWLVPGGHIDKDESPVQTIVREIKEELDEEVQRKHIEFFDISITDINSTYPCKRHYDFWYLFKLSKPISFNYTQEEFKIAEWMSIEEAINRLEDEGQKSVLEKLSNI